jgi:hypothetical protein
MIGRVIAAALALGLLASSAWAGPGCPRQAQYSAQLAAATAVPPPASAAVESDGASVADEAEAEAAN